MRRAYLLTMTATACAVALSLVIGLVAYGAPATANEPEPSLECATALAEEAYQDARYQYQDAHEEWKKTKYRRHWKARTAAVAVLERAAEVRWDAWDWWMKNDRTAAFTTDWPDLRRLLATGGCDDR